MVPVMSSPDIRTNRQRHLVVESLITPKAITWTFGDTWTAKQDLTSEVGRDGTEVVIHFWSCPEPDAEF